MNQDSHRGLPRFIVLPPKDSAVGAYEICRRGVRRMASTVTIGFAERKLKGREKDPDRNEDPK
jgi:hypothetical protein